MNKALILVLVCLFAATTSFAADFAVAKGAMILQGTIAFEQRAV